MKKLVIIILLIISSSLFAQKKKKDKSPELDYKVLGVFIQGNNYYLQTEKGLLKYSEKDPLQEYYRKIYNDSTIINPNTELNSQNSYSNLNFINPIIDISKFGNDYKGFNENLHLYDFMQIDENGNFVFVPGILNIISNQQTNKK